MCLDCAVWSDNGIVFCLKQLSRQQRSSRHLLYKVTHKYNDAQCPCYPLFLLQILYWSESFHLRPAKEGEETETEGEHRIPQLIQTREEKTWNGTVCCQLVAGYDGYLNLLVTKLYVPLLVGSGRESSGFTWPQQTSERAGCFHLENPSSRYAQEETSPSAAHERVPERA